MALTSTVNKIIYSGNGVATSFAFAFPILDSSHLSVIHTAADGSETTLGSSLYGLSGPAPWPNGGSITYPLTGTPIAADEKLTIVRTVPYTQTDRFSNSGGYYPEVIEKRLDLIYMALQQFEERLSRVDLNSISDPATEQSNYALIQALQADLGDLDKLTTQGDLLTRDASSYIRLARGGTDQVLSVSGGSLVWRTLATYPVFSGQRRQTVAAGPVTSAGLPNFLPTSSGSLNLTSQNVSSSYPLVATAAGGWSTTTGGPVDTIGVATANITWTGLAASRGAPSPNYIYGVIANGAITPGSTILAPIYQWGGTPSTANGQITFNIGEMRCYLGNGTTAPQVNLVVFGEVTTNASQVNGSTAYAYNGLYQSTFTTPLPGTATYTAVSHNIGVKPGLAKLVIENITPQHGYVAGEQITEGHITIHSTSYSPLPIITTAKTIAMRSGVSTAHACMDNTGVVQTMTAANWKYSFFADRGW